MRWTAVVVLCAVLATTIAKPEPKKYRSQIKAKDKTTTTTASPISDEERKFLREVEAKFGIKPDLTEVPKANKEDEINKEPKESDIKPIKPIKTTTKVPFPAVIAIEIVNDTETESRVKNKKRTIDANLGYGYRTNNGYTYTYLGKKEEKGKFMIYPYSQEDIPPRHNQANSHSDHQDSYHHQTKTDVEITPSQAYELVPEPAKDEEPAPYHYDKPAVEFKTKYENDGSAKTPQSQSHSQGNPSSTTLYTTYNGQQFSGLTGQFPVMPNYLVDSSQLLSSPQYQNAGLTQDHLQSHAHAGQRVVPVLVLKIPSSYLKNPSAELYTNLPQNYSLSHYLNNVNLQDLVDQYFKKIGYHQAPQVMAYHHSPLTSDLPTSAPVLNQEPQQYAHPYVQPSYTHNYYSGVQYSAVQPVMARYPTGYEQQYYMTQGQSLYRQPMQQQYVYDYHQAPQYTVPNQMYYIQPQQQVATEEAYQSPHQHQEQPVEQAHAHGTNAHVGYEDQSSVSEYSSQTPAPEYGSPSATPDYQSVDTATSHAELAQNDHHESVNPNIQIQNYGVQSQSQYEQPGQKETVAIYPRAQSGHRYNADQSYAYQQQSSEEDSNHGLVLTENYPSKDHTIATVLPVAYKHRPSVSESAQAVSYVTPVPQMKFHSQYKVMVPQTILRNPNSDKVSYVNSHPAASYHGGSSNPEEEYTVGSQYIPPVGKQKAPSYPRNYHSYPKRMVRPEHSKLETVTLVKKIERIERKKSS